ncbi:MAG: DUF309 domain-containing protein [Cyanobacteria bacterium P01_F01_bin.150]
MTTDRRSDIPPEFWQGVEEFNTKDFYACHDTWEAIWLEAIEVDRNFYQGLIQIAVGLYHLRNHNWQGCVILMGEGLQRLGAYQPDYFEIEVTPFIESVQYLLQAIQQAGPENVESLASQVHAGNETVEDNSQSSNGTVEQLPQLRLRAPTIARII